MTRKMYDATNPILMPNDGDLYAGYVGGQWPTFSQLPALFPGKKYVSIAVNSTEAAQVGDVENGDITSPKSLVWVRWRRSLGLDPTLYASTSMWFDGNPTKGIPSVVAVFAAAHEPLPHWWEANYSSGPYLRSGSNATVAHQYTDFQDHYDISIVADYWPGVDSAPTPAASSTPVFAAPQPPVNFPGDAMTKHPLQVQIGAGNGWCPLPAGVTADQVISVVVDGISPNDPTVGHYVPVPAFVSLSTNVGAEIEFGPGAYGAAPDGIYGFSLWTAD